MPWYADFEELRREVEKVRAKGPSQFENERWVRIMCDYSAGGVWHKDGSGGLALSLPIGIELIDHIERWQDVYETNDYTDPDGHHWTEEETVAFAAEGLAIAVEVKRQLPDWTVIYFDEARSSQDREALPSEHWTDMVRRLRPWFEYEITPEVVATGKPPDNYPN